MTVQTCCKLNLSYLVSSEVIVTVLSRIYSQNSCIGSASSPHDPPRDGDGGFAGDIFGFAMVLFLGIRGAGGVVVVGGCVSDVLMPSAKIVFWQTLTGFLKPEVRLLLPASSFCFYIAYNQRLNYLYFTLTSG